MRDQNANHCPSDQAIHRHSRQDVATTLLEFKQRPDFHSQRTFARLHQIPRGTLQHWLTREASIDARSEWVTFFERPAGLAFLHRLQVAAHFVMTLLGPMGVRMVALLLDLAGLAPFIATSYGAQRTVNVALLDKMGAFEDIERPALVEKMRQSLDERGLSHREIITLQDETFHPGVCLVAIEAQSNFILLEGYRPRRDAKTWSDSMDAALKDLPVKVIAGCSDEAKALKAHICRDLGATHICEIFHAQREITRGCSATLARRERHAREKVEKHSDRLGALEETPVEEGQQAIQRGRRLLAEQALNRARLKLMDAEKDRQAMREVVRGIGDAYHPFDLTTGEARPDSKIREDLEAKYEQAREIAERTGLAQSARDRIEKSARLKEGIVASVAFYHALIEKRLASLRIGPGLRELIAMNLIPCLYLKEAAAKARDAAARDRILTVAGRLHVRVESDRRWQSLPNAARSAYQDFARECAKLFVRSSSAVEGRNGQLALHHHGLHRLSPKKLRALTITHNYFITRPDGTTAAERFFGSSPADLFEWLVETMPLPSRPARKRSQLRKAA